MRRIIAAVTFMLRTIPQKNTLNRLSCQLSSLTRCKKNIACKAKDLKMIITRSAKENFTWELVRQFGRGLSVNKVDNCGDGLAPKMRGNKRRNEECPSHLYKVAVLSLYNTILSMSARAEKLRKSALRSQHLAKFMRQVLTPRVRAKNLIEVENWACIMRIKDW